MNGGTVLLQDIELPPEGLPGAVLAAMPVIAVLLLVMVGWYWRRRQQPLLRALRRLRALPDTPSRPDALAAILRQGLQVRRLSESRLPADFLQRLDHARFSPRPCTAREFIFLKLEARTLLEER